MAINAPGTDEHLGWEEDDKTDTFFKALESALRLTQEKGLTIGQKVCCLGDNCVYQLFEIKGDVAIVGIPGEIKKEFLVKDLFDPDIAVSEANRITREKRIPGEKN